jgi:hypothetical protein
MFEILTVPWDILLFSLANLDKCEIMSLIEQRTNIQFGKIYDLSISILNTNLFSIKTRQTYVNKSKSKN